MLTSTLESLAIDTWERLRDAQALGILFGEETITDVLLLDLKRLASPRSWVLQTPKTHEKDKGTDWEWWLGSNRRGWIRLAIQAKKLHIPTGRYNALAHKVGSQMQIDLLEAYANKNGAIPAYCLYNHVSPTNGKKAWNCCNHTIDLPQLACTLAPLSVVRTAINTRGARKFEDLHGSPEVLPWRCLVKCILPRHLPPKGVPKLAPAAAAKLLGSIPRIYPRLPLEVQSGRTTGRVEKFSSDSYSGATESLFPKRIVVLESSPEEEHESVG